jgi:subtilase family serine protease
VRRLGFALVVAVAVGASAAPAAAASTNASANGQIHRDKRVCTATPAPLTATCDSRVRVKDDNVTPAATTTYTSGFSASQLQKAYNVPVPGSGAVVAVVDAYANPNANADLAAYRSTMGLTATTITEKSQTGGPISDVAGNTGWGQEESLDLDMVSAMCPACTILYVGAKSASYADLATAVRYAHSLGAKVISNSYGGSEYSGESAYAASYSYPDAVVTVSAGDSGYGAQFPAALPDVVAVGGTSLYLTSAGARSSETVWSGTGSGCSRYMAKPSWQHDPLCSRRTIVDVSAVANPNTGVAVYDSYGSTGGANWLVFGGTSVAAPLIGGYYAAAGIPATSATLPYPIAVTYSAAAGSFYDVTSGSNGSCGRKTSSAYYLCHARAGFDGPTGLGTPTDASRGAF